MRILMVCLGNICRSPTAEEALRQEAARRGVSVVVGSCGTSGWHVGDGADPRTVAHARRRGLDLSRHRARGLRADDFAVNDRLYAMDGKNLRDLMAACPPEHRHKLFLFLGDGDVPDPWAVGPEGFEHVLDLCEKAAARVVDELLLTAPRAA